VLLEEESTNASNELSTARDQKLCAIKEPSAEEVKEATPASTSTDSPYPDVLLEEESSTNDEGEKVKEEVEDEPEMQPQQQGQQDEQQQLSIAGDEKLSAVKAKEATISTSKDTPDVLLEEESSTNDEGEEVEEEVEDEPEMKSPLQMLDTDNERKVLVNEQWQEGQTDGRVTDSAEDTYSMIMQNIEDDIPSGADL
jgi:hypothetical protein